MIALFAFVRTTLIMEVNIGRLALLEKGTGDFMDASNCYRGRMFVKLNILVVKR